MVMTFMKDAEQVKLNSYSYFLCILLIQIILFLVLIEKHRKPKWQPASLEEISDKMVEEYFAPLSSSDELIIS